jgi:hypothetical protein
MRNYPDAWGGNSARLVIALARNYTTLITYLINCIVLGGLLLKYLIAIMLLFVVSPVVEAATKVVSTGDWSTCIYSFWMPDKLAAYGDFSYPNPILDQGGSDTAEAFMHSQSFMGFGAPAVDYHVNCMLAEPDVLLLMIGMNDAFYDNGDYVNAQNFQVYKNLMGMSFDEFAAQPFRVVIGSITPVAEEIAAAYSGQANQHSNVRIDQYNAWLKQEADNHGFLYLDMNTTMKTVPNWDTVILGADGVHPNYYTGGDAWMASQFAQAAALATQPNAIVTTNVKVNALTVQNLHVMANLTTDSLVAGSLTIGGDVAMVPEPSGFALLLTATLGSMLLWRRRS